MSLHEYQRSFIDFLVTSEALMFGEFVLKSGRTAPYFVNAGRFNSGSKIHQLGKFYAAHIMRLRLGHVTSIFGPAYKGIPISVTTAIALATDHNVDIGYTFDRKEAKKHGDKGNFVGLQLSPNDSLVIVDDVITAGTTFKRMIPILRKQLSVKVEGIVILVDRCEKGEGGSSAADEIQSVLQVPVNPIVTIYDIRDYLSQKNSSGLLLKPDQVKSIDSYLNEYGAKK